MSGLLSTLALNERQRLYIQAKQREIDILQQEKATGRKADVGLDLGYAAGRAISLRREFDEATTLQNTVRLVKGRLQTTQAALGTIRESAESMLKSLLSLREGSISQRVLSQQGGERLADLVTALNQTFEGEALFGGVNTAVTPMTAYLSVPPPPGRAAVDAAFLGAFGFPQGAAGSAAITGPDMDAYLTGAFHDLFQPPDWTANWSAASDVPMRFRLSGSDRLDISISANDPGFRSLAEGFTVLASVGIETLSDAAYKAAIDRAIVLISDGIGGVIAAASRLGATEGRLSEADTRLDQEATIINRRIQDLESVDLYETSLRLNSALTDMEALFQVTARIKQLTLLDHIR